MNGTDTGRVAETGWPCLDFVNTLHWRAAAEPKETLHDVADLAAWARGTGQPHGRTPAGEEPHMFARAIAFREALARIFTAVAHDAAPEAKDLAALMRAHGRATSGNMLVPEGDHFALRPAHDETAGALDVMLDAIAASAVDLLTSPDLRRVRQCADDRGCGQFFFDASKNRTRRWCSMELCGNRAKRRRNYRRHRP
jgi:predicted RNA-binding Zn ribbon-like protein